MDLDAGRQLELLLRLVVALALSAIVGIERELHHEQAGLRTHSLVGLGASVFTVVSAFGFATGDPDPTRIAAGIVTGVGFIGAGTILRQEGSVRGLSTAASLWTVGAIGMAAGAGLFVLAIGATLLALFVLEVLDRFEQVALRRTPIDRHDGGPPHDPGPAPGS